MEAAAVATGLCVAGVTESPHGPAGGQHGLEELQHAPVDLLNLVDDGGGPVCGPRRETGTPAPTSTL